VSWAAKGVAHWMARESVRRQLNAVWRRRTYSQRVGGGTKLASLYLVCVYIIDSNAASQGAPTRWYLFTVSNSGLLSVTERVSTTPSQSGPIPSPTPLRS